MSRYELSLAEEPILLHLENFDFPFWGGEDGALARSMMAEGFVVVREPVGQPLPFDEARLASYRPDLALQDTRKQAF